MIDLYGMSSPNVYKITIMLEECELPYRCHHVNVFAGEQFEPGFLRIGPNNKVPVLVDEQGPEGVPFSVFESGAILLYLAGKCARLLPDRPAARSLVEQWLMVQIASVGPMFGQCVHFLRHAPAGSDYARERYTSEVQRIFRILERRLGESAFLGGAEYSIADVATFPWIRTATMIFPWLKSTPGPGLDAPSEEALAGCPAVRRWFGQLAARPAVQRGLAAGDRFAPQDVAAFRSADPDAVDRFFGRGRFAQR